MRINKIIDEWAKAHRFDYDCYKEQIQDLKDRIEEKTGRAK